MRGVFCVGAMCHVKDGYNVGLGLRKRESSPKFNRGPKT
jgi:hypothetical protein